MKISARRDYREQAEHELADELPDDEAGLFAVAAQAVEAFDAAVIAGNGAGADDADNRYQVAVWKLNGRTYFASMADELAPGRRIERHCAAEPGQVPKWGQQGAFVIEVDGVRAWVEVEGLSRSWAHFQFNAVDIDAVFISETGYRSHIGVPLVGLTVKQAAISVFQDYARQGKEGIRPECRKRLAREKLPGWIAELDPKPRRSESGPLVPPGYELVEAIVTEQQAFIINQWAEAAAKNIEKATKKRRNRT